ncbi:hypothetical protein [Longimicrobium terrae]|uniref:Uncharacterized protein n=1 Tax=Longimicrobium terrae TaxID=1639882 RepID=A0A841H5Y5_9BACT|nr:hypothetical protein [Longimicrobium terrae]MBB4639247.1 hypothetical protein [Longimicrobium terrae]MBB6073487.1 hypothetical protein [Longimicrobium terrae]NNC32263.1 hypothetical protein [Longimicrobium terrae]
MEPTDLERYLQSAITEHLDGDASRFEELWERVPGFGQKARDLTRDIGDVQWRDRTLDGWYCVDTGSGYEVYTQERGIKSDTHSFSTGAEATTYFLRSLGYLR